MLSIKTNRVIILIRELFEYVFAYAVLNAIGYIYICIADLYVELLKLNIIYTIHTLSIICVMFYNHEIICNKESIEAKWIFKRNNFTLGMVLLICGIMVFVWDITSLVFKGMLLYPFIIAFLFTTYMVHFSKGKLIVGFRGQIEEV